MNDQPMTDFEKAATSSDQTSVLGELWDFLKNSKKWWLLPIVVIFLLFGVLLLLSQSAAAPFIYTLF
jgi:hypothetical protein